uniref:Uncharacterized protein n=1 Tax=Triticum urartu TaxID=4572 RepID=A0A8R7PRF8_TRIUA
FIREEVVFLCEKVIKHILYYTFQIPKQDSNTTDIVKTTTKSKSLVNTTGDSPWWLQVVI